MLSAYARVYVDVFGMSRIGTVALKRASVPRVVFTDPQAAAVGAGEARFSATTPMSDVSRMATYTHEYAKSNGFLTLLSDGEVLTGACLLDRKLARAVQPFCQ